MGLAAFYNGLGDLSDLLSVLEPARDVYGGEFYYNAAINPWFHLSFDLQVVEPSLQSPDPILPRCKATKRHKKTKERMRVQVFADFRAFWWQHLHSPLLVLMLWFFALRWCQCEGVAVFVSSVSFCSKTLF